MANPRPLKLKKCDNSTDSKKHYFGAKSIRSLEKNPNFGPQNGNYSEILPSSQEVIALFQ
jgi:hypothetical protein